MAVGDKRTRDAITAHTLTLNNALSDEVIAAKLARRGFSADRITNEGLALIKAAQAKQTARQGAEGAQIQATQTFKTAFAEARKSLADVRETARAHYRSAKANPGVWQSLMLSGRFPQNSDGFISAATTVLDSILADATILADLTGYGYDEAAIAEVRAKIDAMAAANQAQEQAKGRRQQSVLERDEAYRAMTGWMSRFKRIARRLLTPEERTKVGW